MNDDKNRRKLERLLKYTKFTPGPLSSGDGGRSQVFQVFVHWAMTGAPWELLGADTLKAHKINPKEIEQEVERRRGGSGGSATAAVPKKPKPST